jgi:hypothetical protein
VRIPGFFAFPRAHSAGTPSRSEQMSRSLRHLLPALLLLAPLAACDGGTDGGPGNPAHLAASAGDAQTATAGQALAAPLTVHVTDSRSRPVPAATVQFQVISGGGSVTPGSAATDAQGNAQATWTLGTSTAAAQQVEARVLDASGAAVAADTFTATATAGAPASITPVGASALTGPAGAALADSVAVLVRDPFGNPVPGTAVVWSVQTGGGSVSPANTTTSPLGVAKAAWTLGLALGEQTLRAAAGLTLATTFTATAQFPGGALLVKVSGDNQTGSALSTLPQPLVVELRTLAGQPIQGATITWLTHQDGALTPSTSVTGADGRASAQWMLGTQSVDQQAVASAGGGASVTFAATTTFPIRLTIYAPARGATVLADSLDVGVSVISDREPQSLTATVDGRTIPLTFRSQSGTFTGRLDLTGLQTGTKTLRVVARDVAGDSAVATTTFTYAHAPTQLTVLLPIPNMTANPDIPIEATCGDCATIQAKVGTTVIASGTTTIATNASLAAFADPASATRLVTLTIVGTSASGQSIQQSVPVYAFNNPNLERVAYGGIRMLDVSGGRALYATARDAQSALHLVIRNLSTGTETDIATLLPFADIDAGFLTSAGAIWESTLSGTTRVGEYRGVAPIDLGQADHFGQADHAAGSLVVEGRWAAWSHGSTLVLRDLQSGTNQTVASDLFSASQVRQFDVAANGDVVYVNAARQLVRVRLGVPTPLTADAAYLIDQPRTDGTNVVFTRITAGCAAEPCSATVRIGPDGTEVLAQQGFPEYETNNGWVAFRKPGPTGVMQVWTRSPAGVLEQRTNLGTDSSIESLGPDGEVVVLSAGRRYLNRAGTGDPVRLIMPVAGRYTTSFWRGTTGYVVIENTALRILP